MGRRRHFRDITQKRDILRATVKLVVGDSGGNWLATGSVVFLNVGLGVEAALYDFRGVFKILHQMIFTDIQQFDAHVLTEIGLINQGFYATPGGLDTLEIRVMHHRIQLATDLVIQCRNVTIQQGFIQLFHFFRRLLQQV
ncbi:Uncharacterised protein [Yersinia pekkanenii]|uniref:Uncharacterized protein n=1 Tax=Yersinia pekkanenii TaxID=1288385 RepID=A0A0T9RS15_9GAMM|nr:Uncharacterised protein [Yersinia pekkanenii]